MADTPGVTQTEHRTPEGKAASGNPLTAKKNRKVVILGGAALGLLLLSHKGSKSGSSATADPNAQLQAASDAAAQQAQADQGLVGDLAGTGVIGGGGSAGTSGTVDPGVAAAASTGVDPNDPTIQGIDQALAGLGTELAAEQAAAAPPPNEAPKHNKPKPAKKDGKVQHPSKGAKVQGHTHTTVHGRSFPGATGHHVGPTRVSKGATHHEVTVKYGGHTETHTSVNHGAHWIDNTPGRNPPSRGRPQTVRRRVG